jgi:hypothetical protein
VVELELLDTLIAACQSVDKPALESADQVEEQEFDPIPLLQSDPIEEWAAGVEIPEEALPEIPDELSDDMRRVVEQEFGFSSTTKRKRGRPRKHVKLTDAPFETPGDTWDD